MADFLTEYEAARGGTAAPQAPSAPQKPQSWLDEYDAARPVSIPEAMQQAGGSVGRGLAEIPAGLVDWASIAAGGLSKLAAQADQRVAPGAAGAADALGAFSQGAAEFAEGIRGAAAEAMPQVERLRDSFLLSQGPQALGTSVGFLLPGGWLKAAGVPTWASTLSLGAAVQGAAQYHDARLAGAPEEDQWAAFALGMGVGASEAIPLSRILNRADKATNGGIRHSLMDAVIEGGEEWLQESGSQFASNAIASEILRYDEDRALLQDVIQNGNAGFFSGVILSALATASAHSLAPNTRKTEIEAVADDVVTALNQPLGKFTINYGKARQARAETPPAKAETKGPEPAPAPAKSETKPAKAETPPAPLAPAPPAAPASAGPEAQGTAQPVVGGRFGAKPAKAETYAHTFTPASNSSVQPGDELTSVSIMPIENLREFNPGKKPEERKVLEIMEAMKRGETLPPVIASQPMAVGKGDEGKLIIDDGSHRIEAARRLGYTKVPVRVVKEKEVQPVPSDAEAETSLRRVLDLARAPMGTDEGGMALTDEIERARRVLDVRKAAGKSTELDQDLENLVASLLENPAEIGTRAEKLQGDRSLNALKAAEARLKKPAAPAPAQATTYKHGSKLAVNTVKFEGLSEVGEVPIASVTETQSKNFRSAVDEDRVAALAKEMKAGTELPPIVVLRKPDGTLQVVDGHHRLEAAKRAGFKNVPVREVGAKKEAAPAAPPQAARASAEQELAALEAEFQAAGVKLREARVAAQSPEGKALRAAQEAIRNKVLTLQNEIEVAKKQGRPARSLDDVLSGTYPGPKYGVRVGLGKQLIGIERVEDATAVADRLRKESGAGASEMPPLSVVEFDTGKVVARVSYNGRLWQPDNQTPWGSEAPKALPAAPAPAAQPFTRDAIQQAFGVPEDQAHALEALATALGLPPGRLKIVKGGKPGQNALHQDGNARWYYSNTARAIELWQGKGTPEQLKKHLAKYAGTKEELEWINTIALKAGKFTLDLFLERASSMGGTVTRDHVLQWLQGLTPEVALVRTALAEPEDYPYAVQNLGQIKGFADMRGRETQSLRSSPEMPFIRVRDKDGQTLAIYSVQRREAYDRTTLFGHLEDQRARGRGAESTIRVPQHLLNIMPGEVKDLTDDAVLRNELADATKTRMGALAFWEVDDATARARGWGRQPRPEFPTNLLPEGVRITWERSTEWSDLMPGLGQYTLYRLNAQGHDGNDFFVVASEERGDFQLYFNDPRKSESEPYPLNAFNSLESAIGAVQGLVVERFEGDTRFAEYTEEGGTRYTETLLRFPQAKGPSTHWAHESVIAHLRTKERMTRDGRDALFIEEIQSDWHQKGAQKGYRTRADLKRRDRLDQLALKVGEKQQMAELRSRESWDKLAKSPEMKEAINVERGVLEVVVRSMPASKLFEHVYGTDWRLELDPVTKSGTGKRLSKYEEPLDRPARLEALTGYESAALLQQIDWLSLSFAPQNEPLAISAPEVLRHIGGKSEYTRARQAIAAEQARQERLERRVQHWKARRERVQDAARLQDDLIRKRIPDAPFKGRGWVRLALKRALVQAAQRNLPVVAWTTGRMQERRYNLSQVVEEIRWNLSGGLQKGVLIRLQMNHGGAVDITATLAGEITYSSMAGLEGQTLSEVIGARLAEHVVTTASERSQSSALDAIEVELPSGEDSGMRAFYDRELVNIANDLGKKYGFKVRLEKSIEESDPVGKREVWTFELSDEARARILKEGFPLFQGAKGAVEFTEAGEAIIHALEAPDVSTGVHELAHVARRWLFDRTVPADMRAGITDEDIGVAEKWSGAEGGTWTVEAEEKFARGFERYLREGKAPTTGLSALFQKFAGWLRSIYRTIKGSPIDVKLTPAMRAVFDKSVQRAPREPGPRVEEAALRVAPPPAEAARAEKSEAQEALNAPASAVLGIDTEIELADGTALPARYALISADDLVPSHNPLKGFARNAAGDVNERDYGDPVEGKPFRENVERIAAEPKIRFLAADSPTPTDGPPIATTKGVVLGGNARTMAMQLAYSRGAEQFAQQVRVAAASKFGIDPARAAAVKNPVIVRMVASGVEGKPGELSRILNESFTTAKGATTEAVSRGAHVSEQAAREIVAAMGDGSLRDALGDAGKAREILRALVMSGAFTQNDLTTLVDPNRGIPTQAGKQVIEDALLGAVIQDVRTLSEATPATRQTVLRSLPALVRIKVHLPGIATIVTHAVQGSTELRSSGQPLADALRQQVLPGVDDGWKLNPTAVAILRSFENDTPTVTAKKFAAAAQEIADVAAGQGSLFEATPATPLVSLARQFDVTVAEREGLVKQDEDVDDGGGKGGTLFDPGELPVEMGDVRPGDPLQGGGANLSSPIGDRLIGQLAPVQQTADRASLPEIIDALSKVIESVGGATPIRWGRLGTKKARGIFKVGPEVIRVKRANNVATAAHEVGHALEKHVFGWPDGGPWVKPNVGKKEQQELVNLGKALYGKTKPAGGYKREGFAEYIRLHVTDPDKARREAPAFTAYFEGDFLAKRPSTRAALLEVRRLVGVYGSQGSRARAEQGMVNPTSLTYRASRLWQRMSLEAVLEALGEVARPLKRVAKKAEERLERELLLSENPYELTKQLRMTHSGRVARMVTEGMIDLASNTVGGSLEEATALVRGRRQDFTLYLWAKRSLALLRPENGREPRDPGMSLQDARQLIQELETPEFQLAAQKVYDWLDGVLNYAAQASPSFARVVTAIRAADVGFYIPLQREFDALDEAWAKEKRRRGLSAGGGGVAKRLKGSGRRIKDPFPAMISNAERTVLAAHRRMVIDAMLKLSNVEGMGELIEEVPRDQLPVAEVQISEVIDRINKMVMARSGWGGDGGALGVDKEAPAEMQAALQDLMGETLTFFAPAQFAMGSDPIVSVWDGKQVRWFWLDHRIARTLAGMDQFRLPYVLDLLLGLPKRLLVMGTTGIRASFALLTNPAMDVQTLYSNSQASASGPRLLLDWLGRMGRSALHAGTGGMVSDPIMDQWIALGGQMANSLASDTNPAERVARRLFQGRVARVLDPRNAFDFIRDLLQFPESATRTAEIKAVARDIGWEPGTPLSLEQSLQLLRAGSQVSVDFRAAGWLGRVLNQAIPFFNVSFQAPRSAIRAARRNPARFAWRGLQLSAIALALWWEIKDEDWYTEMEAKTKAMYWKLRFTWNGREELVLIPRRNETGMLFGAMVEAFADAWYRKDPQGMREFMASWWDTAHPPTLPVLVEEGIEQLSNRDLYWKTKIVPTDELGLPAEEQVGDYTTLAARGIAKVFGALGADDKSPWRSPRRIEHAMRGVLGGAPFDVLDAVGPPRPRGEAGDLPVAGRLFQRGGPLGLRPRSVQRLYDELEKAQMHAASRTREETQAQRQVRLMLEDAARAVSQASVLRSVSQSAEERRKLTELQVDLATRALQDAADGHAARAPMQNERRRLERRVEALTGGK